MEFVKFFKFKKSVSLLLSISLLVSCFALIGSKEAYASTVSLESVNVLQDAVAPRSESGSELGYTNLVLNGDFEDVDLNGEAQDWLKINYSPSTSPEHSIDASEAYSGNQSYKLSSDVMSRGSFRQNVMLPEDAPGKRYKLQAWIKTEDILESGKVFLRYQILRQSDGTRIGGIVYVPASTLTGTTEWTLYEREFVAPAEAHKINLEGFLENATGVAWFDDIQLFEVDADGNPVVPLPEPEPEPESDPGNIVLNGNFEGVDVGGNALNWSVVNYSPSTPPVHSIDTSEARSGDQSYKLSTDVVSRGSFRQFVILPEDAPGKTFKLQTWIKTENVAGEGSTEGSVYLRYQIQRESDGGRIGGIVYVPASKVTGTTDWTLYEVEFTAPNEAYRLNIEGFLDNATGTAWFDDIRIEEVLPYVSEDGNLLPNGDFETTESAAAWADGVGAANVSTWNASGAPVFAIDDDVYYSGNKSVRIEGGAISRGAIVMDLATLETEKPYLISGWYKTENVSNTIFVRFQYKRDNGSGGATTINLPLINLVAGTNDWTYFNQIVTLPSNMSDNVTKIEAFLENSSGKVWFDNFAIKEHVPIEEVMLNPSIIELASGQTASISKIFTPEDASNQVLAWRSSNPGIASVSSDGEVTALAAGYSIVTATSEENNVTRRRSVVVAVDIDAPASLTVEPYAGNVEENGGLTAALLASDSEGASITFAKTADPNYGKATVSEDGTLRYYPDHDFVGTDSFVYMVSTPAGGPKFGVATITVTAVEQAPELDMLWYSTHKDTALTAQLGNIVSPTNEQINWSVLATPQQGDATVQQDGTFTYTPLENYVGYDKFTVTAATAEGVSTTAEVMIFVIPNEADFTAGMNATIGGDVHPRIIATDDEFAYLRSLLGTDEYFTEWVDLVIDQASEFVVSEDTGLNHNELLNTALLYQLTLDQKYADRAIAHLEFLATDESVAWPGTYNSMLSLSYLAYTTGLAYDWLYNEMSPQQRQLVEEMASEHIFSHALGWYRGQTSIQELNNINLVDNGSFGLLALAMLQVDGQVGDEAVEVLQGVYNKLQIAIRHQTADGTWPEGPHYWQFGTQPLFLFMAGMASAIGTDYGLIELPGMEEIGYYPAYLHGQGGAFNFADNENIVGIHPQLLWLADVFNKPEIAWYAIQLYKDHGVFSPLNVLFYKPGMFDTEPPEELDRAYPGVSVITMRSDWFDPDGIYAAMKGFKDQLKSHVDMDAGTFIFDALGERWALDLGNENYNLPGFWNYEGQRWTYYRKGLQGHNSIIINPDANPLLMQDPHGQAPLIDSASKSRGSYGVIDMTDRYPNDAVSFHRGMMMTGDRTELIVQDEMVLKSPSEIYWVMHTEADITVIEDGRAAILTQNDKKLYVKMLEAPDGAVFSELSIDPLPNTPNPVGQRVNYGVSKLAVHMMNVQEANLSIWMVPLNEEDPLPTLAPAFKLINDWTIPDGELPVKQALPTVSAINVDGQLVAGFKPTETYYKVVLPFNATEIPTVGTESVNSLSQVDATIIPGRTLIYVTDPVNPSNTNRYTIEFVRGPYIGNPAEANHWPIVGEVIASASPQANLGHTPDKTIDNDFITRWAAEGNHWIQYDLGEEREVGAVSLAYISGDTRLSYFTISTSLNGTDWSTVYDNGASSGLTLEPEVFFFASAQARYVRVNVLGNESSAWNSLAEVAIFRTNPVTINLDVVKSWIVGERHDLAVKLAYYDGRQVEASDVTYTSSDPTIVSVNEQGVATGLKAGIVQLTVTDEEFGLSDTWTITVNARSNPPGEPSEPSEPGEPTQPVEPNEPNESTDPTDAGDTSTTPSVELSDISGHWAANQIKQAVERSIVKGYPDGTFQPNKVTSRAEFTVMLMNALLLETVGAELPFQDNDKIGGWAKEAIAKAIEAGIINGYGDGTFRPNAGITRAEMVVMIGRAFGLISASEDAAKFADDADIPQWAKGMVTTAHELGIVEGRSDNEFKPNELATRAEAITILLRILEMINK